MAKSEAIASDECATVADHGGATSDMDINVEDAPKQEAVDMGIRRDTGQFEEGEEVLAWFKVLIFDAKILKADFKNGVWRYRIHYYGWRKRWDEWVTDQRLMKITKENLDKKEELMKKEELYNIAKRRAVQLKRKISIVVHTLTEISRSATAHSVQKKEVSPLTENRPVIHIPPALKKLLVNDWESRKQLGKLVELPRSPTVYEILCKYRDYRIKEGTGWLAVSVEEIVKGLRCYFDNALKPLLLYDNERQQYEEVIFGDITPAEVYGAEHLLRLFVKLPEISHGANVIESSITDLELILADFLKFFENYHNQFYHVAYRFEGQVSGENRLELEFSCIRLTE